MRYFKHVKTGKEYRLIDDDVMIEATMTPAVVYSAVLVGGGTWVRPKSEFFDGRFVELPKPKGRAL